MADPQANAPIPAKMFLHRKKKPDKHRFDVITISILFKPRSA
jgi:hypothetical protein